MNKRESMPLRLFASNNQVKANMAKDLDMLHQRKYREPTSMCKIKMLPPLHTYYCGPKKNRQYQEPGKM